MTRVTRRGFVGGLAGLLGAVATACDWPSATGPTASGSARLLARPGTPTLDGPLGLRALGLAPTIDGAVYVSPTVVPDGPRPLVLLLHGAGGTGLNFIQGFIADADATGQVLLAVDSRRATWDGIGGRFGPDIDFLDAALADTFARYAIDPARVAVAGFSDGATMALALGRANGDLFTHTSAWSPGGLITDEKRGRTACFVTHGRGDRVLPIDVTQRTVARLRRDGHAVTYREFLGGHELPADLRLEAMQWMAAATA